MQGLLSFGKSIREFKNTLNKPVFTQAETYPQFFDKHLVHPSRRIKSLTNDPNANIRAFYFQYLLLCYEIQNQNYEFYISKIKKFIMDPNFTFLFLEEDDEKIFNDRQFKRFLLEFMDVLDSGEFQSTEAALNAYPIADLVLVYFFRSLAIYAEITSDFDSYIDKTNLFGFLLQNFNIDAQIFQQKCIKFIQAEVFVYEESPTEVYLVYKDIEQSMSESNHSRASQQEHQQKSYDSMSMLDSKKEDKEEIQQNISMLEEEEIGSSGSLQDKEKYQGEKEKEKEKEGFLQQVQDNNGFKKNKILDNQAVYKRITDEFQQKPSVFSCNDEMGQIQSHIQPNSQRIQYSFKASDPPASSNLQNSSNSYQSSQNPINSSSAEYLHLKQIKQLESSTTKTKPYEVEGPSFLTTHHATPLSQYGLAAVNESPSHGQGMGHGFQVRNFGGLSNSGKFGNVEKEKEKEKELGSYKKMENFGGVPDYNFKTKFNDIKETKDTFYDKYGLNPNPITDDKYSHVQSLTTNYDHKQITTQPQQFHNSHTFNQDLTNRDKTTHSHTIDILSNPNPIRTHSTTLTPSITTPPSNKNLPIPNHHQPLIPHINTHVHPDTPQQAYRQTPMPSNLHYEKLTTFPEINLMKPYAYNQQGTLGQDYGSSSHFNGVGTGGHLAPTRDVPTHDYQQYLGGVKASGISGNTSSRESLSLGNNGKQSEFHSKTSLYFDQKSHFHPPQPQKPQPHPQITLYNPKQKQPTKSQLPSQSNSNSNMPYSQKSPDQQRRDLRQQSISIKQKLKQMVASKLSVSKEFTDSLTLLKMGEPYSTNIKKMKTRSREFRQSILNAIK